MDQTLLEKQRGRAPDADLIKNSETEVPEEQNEVAEYRELAVEAAQPPFRMKLVPPIDFDGKQYNQIVADFDSLIGKDFQRIEKEFTHLYKADRNETPLPEMKHLYHCLVIARAADVPVGLIFRLPRRYYTPIRLEALKACGSSPDEEKA